MKQRVVNETDREIAKRIRAARLVAKKSQGDLGEAIGVTFQQIQKYEKGINRVSASRLQQIAIALNSDLTVLMTGDRASTSPKDNFMAEFFATPYAADVARTFMKLPPSKRLVVRDLVEGFALP